MAMRQLALGWGFVTLVASACVSSDSDLSSSSSGSGSQGKSNGGPSRQRFTRTAKANAFV